MIKKVWIFQTGEPLHFDKIKMRPMRAMNLANNLLEKNCLVTIWTSNFSHQFKEKRLSYGGIKKYRNLTIRYIDSSGYSKNIGFARLIDHFILGLNLFFALLREKEKPHVAFVGFPPIEFSFFASFWLKWQKIPYILDVKDQWPDIFISNLPPFLKKTFKVVLFPYLLLSMYSMKNASALCSMSDSYIKWVYQFANINKNKLAISVPLSSNSFNIKLSKTLIGNHLNKLDILDDERIKILFIGSLSHIFDFETIIKCLILAKKRNIQMQFIICGMGYQEEKLKKIAIKYDLDIVFLGWVSTEEIFALSTVSTIAIAPYKNNKDFLNSIPNKISDYLSLGLPIFSPLGGMVKKLIEKKNAGAFYKQADYNDLFDKLIYLSKNKKHLSVIKKNNKETFSKDFDSNFAYNKLSNFLMELI